jgi:hypothetical protein
VCKNFLITLAVGSGLVRGAIPAIRGTPPGQVPQFGEHSRRAIALKNTLLIWVGLVT